MIFESKASFDVSFPHFFGTSKVNVKRVHLYDLNNACDACVLHPVTMASLAESLEAAYTGKGGRLANVGMVINWGIWECSWEICP